MKDKVHIAPSGKSYQRSKEAFLFVLYKTPFNFCVSNIAENVRNLRTLIGIVWCVLPSVGIRNYCLLEIKCVDKLS